MNVLELQDSNEYQEVQSLKTGTIFYNSEHGYYIKLGWEGKLDKDNGIYYYPTIYLKGGGIKYFPGNQKVKVFKNKLEIKEKGVLDVNKVEVKDCCKKMCIDDMPEGCLFYGTDGDACMKVHYPGKNDSDLCYYVNLRTSFFCKTLNANMFNIISSEVTIRTVW